MGSRAQEAAGDASHGFIGGVRATGRVLLAEDDPAMRALLVGRLQSEGHDVYEAVSGDEVLRMVQTMACDHYPWDGIDLAILDNRMPGTEGLDVIAQLRARHCATPCILMTAFPDRQVEARAARMAATLLPKPFSLRALCERTAELILTHPRGRFEEPPSQRLRLPV